MTTHSYKCPNCRAPLVYQPGEEKSHASSVQVLIQ